MRSPCLIYISTSIDYREACGSWYHGVNPLCWGIWLKSANKVLCCKLMLKFNACLWCANIIGQWQLLMYLKNKCKHFIIYLVLKYFIALSTTDGWLKLNVASCVIRQTSSLIGYTFKTNENATDNRQYWDSYGNIPWMRLMQYDPMGSKVIPWDPTKRGCAYRHGGFYFQGWQLQAHISYSSTRQMLKIW